MVRLLAAVVVVVVVWCRRKQFEPWEFSWLDGDVMAFLGCNVITD
jgi:hypothetical protein